LIKTGAGRQKKDDEEKRRERGRRIAGEELGTIDDAASIDKRDLRKPKVKGGGNRPNGLEDNGGIWR
jgi:hypothetical protein